MTKLLLRLFIKERENTVDPVVRGRYGVLAGVVGIVCNLLLCLAKLGIGILSKSIAITADAVNNLSDASSSVVTLIGFRLSRKRADAQHPFGYARAEYLSGLGVAALILVIGVQLLMSSVKKILHPEQIVFSGALVIVLLLSILVKLWMAAFNHYVGKKIDSTTLLATAADSRNDVISTAAVLVAAVIARQTGLMLDGYIGLLVALFIMYSGIGIGKETIKPLLGESAKPELLELVRSETLGYDPRILGIHDLMVHDYGPGRCFASLHAELDYREDVLEAHELIDAIERMFMEKHHIHLVIHYDPIVTDDKELNILKELVIRILEGINAQISAHDFRIVRGTGRSNLIFDVVLPFTMQEQEGEIQNKVEEALQKKNKHYHTVITFDPQGFN